ncbi:hypothetical protein JY651_27630 [Pyxidicoccus parkwayensis]|uniref:Uncharacterized protein n=1 Tax=Pyxidicoccus parkwayensis TaxID=2813578 RepID=A0ABX7NSI2_9BACT|nr:hypothetical protein [Pyxidicoccus parkwaysis]QSQ19118.1 hypothetical protein JY651_27630 [Pyxidicoccus parkwaysis]
MPSSVQVSDIQVEIDVLTRDEDDSSGGFDSVRSPEPPGLYAFIDDIEVTEGRKGNFYELAFITIDSNWFDSLPDSLEGMTPEAWSRSARESKPARLELVTSEKRLLQIIDRTGGEVSFHAGNWVLLRITEYDPETFEGEGLPVTVFLPTGDRVASIGLNGPAPAHYMVVGIERIRPTSSGLRKLLRFKQAISL